MAQKQSTDHNSDADTDSIEHRKNVVGALFEHFKKWYPEKLVKSEKLTPESRSTETGEIKHACGIQEMRETCTESGQE